MERNRTISPGDELTLKPARAAAYGLATPRVTVTGLRYKPGYKTPWIISDAGAFKPSDFK